MILTPLSKQWTPQAALHQLRDLPWPTLLESARYHRQRGRYSYFTAAPEQTWSRKHVAYGDDPFSDLRTALQDSARPIDPSGPPFQGGIIGLLGYELGHCWERLPRVPTDFFTTPPLVAGLFEWTVCWDHATGDVWLITPQAPQVWARSRAEYAEVWNRLRLEPSESSLTQAERFAPDLELSASPIGLPEDTSREAYLESAQRVIDYIGDGDIYQANYARTYSYEFGGSPLELYRQIRQLNPAPFAAYFQPEVDWAVVSASPEQFLQVDQRQVTTRPIKGTRPRWKAGDLDLLQAAELLGCEKDRAENTMIVDLLRNDLSRVCERGSVTVPRWCELESFETVHHLVSEVTGQLRPECDLWDLLAATFPGGSITGAPKIRAMEIISELEQRARGAYCGCLIAAGWQGTLQSSLLIRTLTWKQGAVQCPVGGGIVADSTPENEYAETQHKLVGLLAGMTDMTAVRNCVFDSAAAT